MGVRDLRVYRAAFRAAMRIFDVSRGFPDEETYGAACQIRRSSRSVGSNTAEARAHLDFALGCGYLDRATYDALDREYARVTRMLVRMLTQAPRWTPAAPAAAPRAKPVPTPIPPIPVGHG